MNNDTLRRLYKIGIIVALVVFAAMLYDYYQNDSDWITPLVIAFTVVALWLILMLLLSPTQVVVASPEPAGAPPVAPPAAAKPTAAAKPKRAQLPRDFKGDVHEVVDLEGIGPVYAEKLHGMGVYNTQELLFTDTGKVAKACDVHEKTVELWKSMSQLAKVRGIGPQYAEALARSGVDGIDSLKHRSAAAMAADVQEKMDSLNVTVVGQPITEKRIKTWQRAAKPMRRVPINMDKLKIMPLESKAARADEARGANPS